MHLYRIQAFCNDLAIDDALGRSTHIHKSTGALGRSTHIHKSIGEANVKMIPVPKAQQPSTLVHGLHHRHGFGYQQQNSKDKASAGPGQCLHIAMDA